jgi:hypothetical protein
LLFPSASGKAPSIYDGKEGVAMPPMDYASLMVFAFTADLKHLCDIASPLKFSSWTLSCLAECEPTRTKDHRKA